MPQPCGGDSPDESRGASSAAARPSPAFRAARRRHRGQPGSACSTRQEFGQFRRNLRTLVSVPRGCRSAEPGLGERLYVDRSDSGFSFRRPRLLGTAALAAMVAIAGPIGAGHRQASVHQPRYTPQVDGTKTLAALLAEQPKVDPSGQRGAGGRLVAYRAGQRPAAAGRPGRRASSGPAMARTNPAWASPRTATSTSRPA